MQMWHLKRHEGEREREKESERKREREREQERAGEEQRCVFEDRRGTEINCESLRETRGRRRNDGKEGKGRRRERQGEEER